MYINKLIEKLDNIHKNETNTGIIFMLSLRLLARHAKDVKKKLAKKIIK